MDLSSYLTELKGLINDLHSSHSDSGDGLSCSVCVLAILDEIDLERSKSGKRFFEGEFF